MGRGLYEVTQQSWTWNKDSRLPSLGLSLYTPVCLHTSHTKHTHPTGNALQTQICKYLDARFHRLTDSLT